MKIYESPPGMVFVPDDHYEAFAALESQLATVTAERDADREYLAQQMIARSIATGHGDTIRDLINELMANYAEVRAGRDRLRTLLLNDWPHSVTGLIDGEDYASLLHEAGLIEWHAVEELCGGPECCCEIGDQCQRLTAIGRAALA